jgi:hypothetical protein
MNGAGRSSRNIATTSKDCSGSSPTIRRVPADVREEANRWGLPKDEFKDNGHWPHQIYVREARRMVGAFVMTENELTKKKPTPDSVGMGSYTIDSHNVRRYVTPEGNVQNEGDIGVPISPYSIAYGALVPKRGECANLFAPVACSATHIAYGSIRMEPVFMILGQSAATAAVLAIDGNLAVQDAPYAALRERLVADGQVLEHASSKETPKGHGAGKSPESLPGVTVTTTPPNARATGSRAPRTAASSATAITMTTKARPAPRAPSSSANSPRPAATRYAWPSSRTRTAAATPRSASNTRMASPNSAPTSRAKAPKPACFLSAPSASKPGTARSQSATMAHRVTC